MDAATAAREAVRTILSGPAAGVVGARAMASGAGFERIITFDMGGTSTDVCLVDGAIRRHAECSVGGVPINVPAIDVHTVGAGGGSIAFRDPGGALAVGPRSAGADPGPACYGRGEEPTVTDANLVLGRLGDGVLAGSLHLKRDRAAKVIERLARQLKLSPRDTALGIVQVANAAMERAIRAVSVERGHDPREFILVAFGGAAPLHACELAADLGIRRVLVPRHAGVLSAWGAASADVVREYVRTVRQTAPSLAVLGQAARELAEDARRDMRDEGVPARAVRLEVSVGVRYAGQSFELDVPLGPRFAREFHALHRRLYGHADTGREIEAVYVGVRASAPQGEAALAPLPRPVRAGGKAARMPVQTSRAVVRAAVVERDGLAPGSRVPGAAVIQELSATTYVPPGWSARVDRLGHLVLRHGR
jgi:N-methylhydantoinase A